MAVERTYWFSKEIAANGEYVAPAKDDPDPERKQVPYEQANLVGSLTTNGLHAPVLDLDFPARLVESSSPGHFHLFLDVEMAWDVYAKLLVALQDAGVLEAGYVHAMLGREATYVRRDGVYKEVGK